MLGNGLGSEVAHLCCGSNLHTELTASVASLSSFIKWGVMLSRGAVGRTKEELMQVKDSVHCRRLAGLSSPRRRSAASKVR